MAATREHGSRRGAPLVLRAETVIDATPEEVWDVLIDVGRWDTWNPTLFGADGEVRVGNDVRMKLRLGKATVPMCQQIRVIDPPRELTWRSKQAVPAAFDVVRSFRLEPLEGGGTRLVQTETATGFLARPILAIIGKLITRGYEELGQALVRRFGGREG